MRCGKETMIQAKRCPNCRGEVSVLTPNFGIGVAREDAQISYPSDIYDRPTLPFDPFNQDHVRPVRRSGRNIVPNSKYKDMELDEGMGNLIVCLK